MANVECKPWLTNRAVSCRLFSPLECGFLNVKIRVLLPTGCSKVCSDHIAQVLSSSTVDSMYSLGKQLCHFSRVLGFGISPIEDSIHE